MWDESWILPYDEIKPDKGGVGLLGSRMSLQSSVASQNAMMSNMQAQAMVKQIFCKTALYNGKSVAVKHVPKKTFHLTKDVRKEVRTVRSLEHQNLARFVGASIEVPNVNIVSEYCPKGSLNDALLNDSIPLNWSFRFSMATDIARGMAFLHSYKMYHGKLKSTNCVIDDRWTVKITDYGVPLLRNINKKSYSKSRNASVPSTPKHAPSSSFCTHIPASVKHTENTSKTQSSMKNKNVNNETQLKSAMTKSLNSIYEESPVTRFSDTFNERNNSLKAEGDSNVRKTNFDPAVSSKSKVVLPPVSNNRQLPPIQSSPGGSLKKSRNQVSPDDSPSKCSSRMSPAVLKPIISGRTSEFTVTLNTGSDPLDDLRSFSQTGATFQATDDINDSNSEEEYISLCGEGDNSPSRSDKSAKTAFKIDDKAEETLASMTQETSKAICTFSESNEAEKPKKVITIRRKNSIFDFGLPILRHGENTEEGEFEEWEEENMYKIKKSKVYQGPEFSDQKNPEPTAAGDVYAFAIILVEIGTRNDPYQDEDPESVEDNWKPPQPDFADETREDRCPSKSQYLALIRDCWNDNAALRPTFDTCKKAIHKMNPNKMSPVDIMMAMMEKYSKHLESLVAERTAEVTVEKEKADRLLYSMIPQAVAEDLKRGKTIKAEQYSSCTIYFSDIVGFTKLSGGSTAMEVVALLNDLYVCFDNIIDMYDVYKVETIGDAYMVVSGVPKVNGIRHSREIAHMATDLRDAAKVFKIRHKPGEPLKIRIGMHSGPVCAGVVGLKMPRYCLFGDTVNTASRMESNGEEYKIHLSQYTYDNLQQLGGFTCEKRGTIPVKGKGEMTTYWLTHRDEDPKKQNEADAKRKISNSNDSGYNEDHDKEKQNKTNGGLPRVFEKREPVGVTREGTAIELTMINEGSNPAINNNDKMPLVE